MINGRVSDLFIFSKSFDDRRGRKLQVNSPSNSDFIWRRFYGKESSPLEAIRELG